MCSTLTQSSDSAKYPLAIVDKLLNVYGPDLAVSYDIGCAFTSTICRSPLLPSKATSLGLHMLVPAFHGHVHNLTCQLAWHLTYILGTGLKDFETYECVFSLSNALAAGTRHLQHFTGIKLLRNTLAFGTNINMQTSVSTMLGDHATIDSCC